MDLNPIGNLFEDIPESLPSEWFQEIVNGTGFRLERIVSAGHRTIDGHWYDQLQAEWVVLLSGAAKIEFKDPAKVVELKPGDYLTILAHTRHRVLWTCQHEKTVWLAVHFDP